MPISKPGIPHSRIALAGLLIVGSNATPAELVNIRYRDITGEPKEGRVLISVIRGTQTCDFRLEYDDPAARPSWAVHEIGGDQGPRQRYSADCNDPPSFVANESANPQFYEEQTTYYWTMKARDYAIRNLWVTPTGWTQPPIGHATTRVDTNVLRTASFNQACLPKPFTGCFRTWPGEGPRIHLRAGSVRPELVAHEYGHYAAGYVFGHMDTVSGWFVECTKRSYQEAVAEMFMSVFLHGVAYEHFRPDALKKGVPNSGSFGSLKHTQGWDGQCGANNNDYVMGRPLVQAFHQLLWDPVWSGDAVHANAVMVDAFSYALASNRGHRLDALVRDIVDRLEKKRSAQEAEAARTIFRSYGFRMVGDRCTSNTECTGPRTTRCDTTRTPNRCIPDDRIGASGDYCTNPNHCGGSLNCFDPPGTRLAECTPQPGIGESCSGGRVCAEGRFCDGNNKCVPKRREGSRGAYCSNNDQCQSGTCPIPGNANSAHCQ